MHARIAHETDLAGFRREARRLVAAQVAPGQVHWTVGETGAGGAHGLFDDAEDDAAALTGPAPVPAPSVPAAFLATCEAVALHRDPQRWSLMYRLLWRLLHEPTLRYDPLDADMLQAQRMARAVQRDMHKMRAFVRFRPVRQGPAADDVLHVAWFEPEHRIAHANAPWFRRRFANLRWALLTPEGCAEWDGQALHLRPGARPEEAPPPDAGEALWLTYYRSIFNPARLNVGQMRKEMPQRYWRNLPEAELIAPLAAQAQLRTERMIEQPAGTPSRRVPRWSPVLPPVAATGTLDELAARTQPCRECPLGASATQAVPGEGPAGARLMFVGEQPGDQEDLRGRPFVGPAGQLLDRALQRVGIARDSVYLTNAVRHFKFELRGKRRIHKTPSQQEALACRHWLDEEIALVRPGALVALGATAARALLGRPVAVLSERGQWFVRDDGLKVLVTLHPSALLRMPPEAMPRAFEDFVRDLGSAQSGE